MEGKPASWDTN